MSQANDGIHWAPTLRPTRAQFERPFVDFVREQFRKHPEWPCFKVIPPAGWKPTKKRINWEDIRIQTPIKQHVFGKSGSYMCILEEQRGMSAADFKRMAEAPSHQAPSSSRRGAPAGAEGEGDRLLERCFWSSVTCNPPLYGADTPLSLFDRELDWGWNLRDLGCLLSDYDVPDIPGVTSPMAYFGMWKSFFGWHKEDIDLYSVNYNHCGASKIWYCVSPKDSAKFDTMARGLFPQAAAACPAFVRHKDVMVSPRVLRSYSVPFVQARQEPGEFIVLNAAAYHSGFNLGFNVAEAVNFALPEWLEVGRDAVNCECEALADSVQLDMGIFFPELREEDSSSEEEEEESEEEEASSSGSEEEEKAQQQQKPAAKRRSGVRRPPPPARRTAALVEVQTGKRGRREGGQSENTPAKKRARPVACAPRTPRVPDVLPGSKAAALPHGSTHAAWGEVAEPRPLALADREPGSREASFGIVHRLARKASRQGAVWVGLLREDPDGLFRPTGVSRQVSLGFQHPRLVHVRTEWMEQPPPVTESGGTAAKGSRRRQGGWKLTTLAKRILMGI